MYSGHAPSCLRFKKDVHAQEGRGRNIGRGSIPHLVPLMLTSAMPSQLLAYLLSIASYCQIPLDKDEIRILLLESV